VKTSMKLPIEPPVLPMLAKRVDALPEGEGWVYEPKWDGFRVVVFRDGDEVLLQSRDEKSLNRYFPELEEPLRAQLPERCVVDGEIVIAREGGLDFDALTLRIHPAASRVKLLAGETPASVVFFDLLAVGDRDLREEPFARRREELERVLAGARAPVHVTPATGDRAVAEDWFRRFEGAGLDGVVAKPAAVRYQPDKRVMLKVKHERECDCVVAGFRWHKNGEGTMVGSLLLGLYDGAGVLHNVGVCASFTTEKRRELVEFLEPYRRDAREGHPWASWAEQPAGGARSGCRAGRAGGARGRTWSGSRCVRSWWWRWRTSTCRRGGSGTCRTFGDGGSTSRPRPARMRSWRWSSRRSCRRSLRADGNRRSARPIGPGAEIYGEGH